MQLALSFNYSLLYVNGHWSPNFPLLNHLHWLVSHVQTVHKSMKNILNNDSQRYGLPRYLVHWTIFEVRLAVPNMCIAKHRRSKSCWTQLVVLWDCLQCICELEDWSKVLYCVWISRHFKALFIHYIALKTFGTLYSLYKFNCPILVDTSAMSSFI